MKKKNIVINGRVLLLPTNGIPRYATEIVRYIDCNVPDEMNIEIVVPEGNLPKLELHRCKYVQLKQGVAWDYTKAEKYAKKKKALYVNMASKGVLYKNSIATVFDIRPISYDPSPKDLRSLRYFLKFKISFLLASKNAKHIVTISEFCKNEILEYSHRNSDEISIIGCGWDHILNIEPDDNIFNEYPQIKKGQFYLSIGSVAPHKNFKWIIENARFNPQTQYVIVGKTDTSLWKDNTNDFNNNIIYLGYQSDERLKALLQNAKALIFPSLYEGFGIPPLEALGLGISTVVSDIAVMREIVGNHASYIETSKTDYKIDTMINQESFDDEWLIDYRWNKQGEKWIHLLERFA